MARKRTTPAPPVSSSPEEETAARVTDGFRSACDRLAPLAAGAGLLLGCSAGGDSMSLLELAAAEAPRRDWRLAVVHVDHAQRPESADEARFVHDRAAALGLTCFIERLPESLVAAGPLSEDVLRAARLRCYVRAAEAWRADALVLAHQADDRAETFLMRLLAGSGPTGLAGIRPIDAVEGLTVVRPLLALRRADLRRFLTARGLTWRDDPTNASEETRRGWLRHAVIPLLRDRLGIDPTERIVRAAELIEEEARALDDAVARLLELLRCQAEPPAVAALDLGRPAWRKSGRLLRRQLLRAWLWDLRRGPHPPGLAAVEEALTFAERGRRDARLRTIERWHLIRRGRKLEAIPPEDA
ncbi:MAG TPA: tRNA lysidine(34) synthetase TilS [Candidatus Sumerlaeota bacterium]|nr:tRNA lysidine(34) synthetase TilS [Candidatus Sumerlaeota bacterium]